MKCPCYSGHQPSNTLAIHTTSQDPASMRVSSSRKRGADLVRSARQEGVGSRLTLPEQDWEGL